MNGSRILVVEDEALIADDLQQTLLRLGYDVPVPSATGREAIAAVARFKPKLVLMDIKLQGTMDGIEAAAQIRRDTNVPVVYLTSHSDDATLERAMETAPSGYLLKPFNDRELKTAIQVALHKHMLETRLADRERWFATTLQSIGDAVIATDPYETITFMNTVAERLTGWLGGEVVGRPLSDVFRLIGADGAPLPSPIKLALQKSFTVSLPPGAGGRGERAPVERSLLVHSGGKIPVDDSAAPIVDDKGELLGGVLVFRDTTERNRMERRVAQSERLASLGTMAAAMGHEINNPLAVILGNFAFATETLQALQLELGDLEQLFGSANQAASVGQRFGQLVDALTDAGAAGKRVRDIVRDLKKFVDGEQSVKTRLELPEILDAAAKLTSNALRHAAGLVKEYGRTPTVEANEGQLTQVFTNLIMNAVRSLEHEKAEGQQIRLVTSTDAEGRAVVEVYDSGPGLSPEVLARLFDPFSSSKPGGEGLGLGLAIAHSIVGGLGGELTVESGPGPGKRFRVALPAAPARVAADRELAQIEAPARRGKVLVVDDDAMVARSLERVLRSDHDVTVATTATAALESIAAAGPFDIIFCDLMMPGISGMDLHESLKATNPEQAGRMVFVTGGAFTARAEEFLDSPDIIHLVKPFAPEVVRGVVARYITRASPRDLN